MPSAPADTPQPSDAPVRPSVDGPQDHTGHVHAHDDGHGHGHGHHDHPHLAAEFDLVFSSLAGPALDAYASRLKNLSSLGEAERVAFVDGLRKNLREVLWQHTSRVVVLELQLARLGGRLTAPDSRGRWLQWVEHLAQPGSWETLAEPYPVLLPRLRTIIRNRCEAAHTVARRFAADRTTVADSLPGSPGEVRKVSFGAGDSHHGGQTVTVLTGDTGRLVYKPRPVGIDVALDRFLRDLIPDEPEETRIRVPRVLERADERGGYGWAEYVDHRYCDGDEELRIFYRNLGHWLAVMRLLSGSDLHFENVVACGPVPVVVDCETLFTPQPPIPESGYGKAVDAAMSRIGQSVLRTGMLPGRGALLGWRGVDASAAAALPGQQPALMVPVVVNHGTDEAKVEKVPMRQKGERNLPSPEPDLYRYWRHVVDGFTDLTERIRELDRAGRLEPMLAGFADCPIRVVVRDTATYGELARMLWHPASLHEPEPALERARQLLIRQGKNRGSAAPDDPAVVDAELAELLVGDVPVFVTAPRSGELTGPGGTRWGAPEDLVASALDRWRNGDPNLDRQVVSASLVAAYLNDTEGIAAAAAGAQDKPVPPGPRPGNLDERRRALAATLVARLIATAIRGDDGTATWVAPTLDVSGYAVRPLGSDLYTGLGGVAVALAAYQAEVAAGRADPVPGAADLLSDVVHTMMRFDEQDARHLAETEAAGIRPRPQPPGAYLGIASRIWSWLLLHRLGVLDRSDAVRLASALADRMSEPIAADQHLDLLGGMAGAIVPLLRLAEWTGESRFSAMAGDVGRRLRELARLADGRARWPNEGFPDGGGGLSHGSTGIGWALARLAEVTGDTSYRELADAAFAFEETLYDASVGAWYDARSVGWGIPPRAWCNGCVGIGLCAVDQLARDTRDDAQARWRDVLSRAVRATWEGAFEENYTVCHGDLGAWELMEHALTLETAPDGLTRDDLLARVLTNVEAYGPQNQSDQDVFVPGMLTGAAGVVYQLLRMHPESGLPSVLLPDPGPAPVTGRRRMIPVRVRNRGAG